LYVGSAQLESVVQATRTFITSTYVGSVTLIAILASVPKASIDAHFTGHVTLEMIVSAQVQFIESSFGLGPPSLVATPAQPGIGLVAIPNPNEDLELIPS